MSTSKEDEPKAQPKNQDSVEHTEEKNSITQLKNHPTEAIESKESCKDSTKHPQNPNSEYNPTKATEQEALNSKSPQASNQSVDALQKELSQLLENCELEDLENLDEEITETEDYIRECTQRNEDVSDFEGRLKDLLRIRQIKQTTATNTDEILEDELRDELQLLGIKEEEINGRLVEVKKQSKFAKKDSKNKEELEALKKRLERLVEITTKLGRGETARANNSKLPAAISQPSVAKSEVKKEFLVKCEGKEKYFPEGELIKDIKAEFGKKGASCFDEQFHEFTQPELNRNLVLLDCDECKVHFKKATLKHVSVPVAIPVREIAKYLPVKGPESLHVSAISVGNDEWTKVQPNNTIHEQTRSATVHEIRLAYTVNLTVEIRRLNSSQQIDYSIESNQPLLQLKQKFQERCNFNAELQKWIINGEEMKNNALTFEDMELEEPNYRVEVHEVFNIEYYGFARITPIKVESFRKFFVEDDNVFLTEIEKSSFPGQDYEFSFRISALGYIFAAVKKHCRILSAIQYIRNLIRNSTKACAVWTPKTAKEKSYFNEHYALHNILHSGDDDLKIEFMRIYKGHSSLPMVSRETSDPERTPKQFYEHHFWVGIKSYVVTSLSVEGTVRGKSTLLNRIFGTDFEVASKRHSLCHGSVYIQYNVYRKDNLLLDLIDVSNDSIRQEEKAELCRASNLVIIHYVKSTEVKTREWVKDNCKGIPVIFVERDSHAMDDNSKFQEQLKSNKLQKLELNYGVPELDEDNLRHNSNQLNLICDQIHTFLKENIEDSKSCQQLWRFTEFLAKKSGDPKLMDFVKILRDIEANFATVIDASLLLSTDASSKSESNILSPILEHAIGSIEHEHIDRAMSKLKESIRVLRSNRLGAFSSISAFEKSIEKKSDQSLEATKADVSAFFSEMRKIPEDQTTERFRQLVASFDELKNSPLTVEAVSTLVKKIREEFNEEIKPRQFSIENLWRVFAKLAAQRKQGSESLQRALQIYAREFVGGKTFEVINGETLEVPMELLRSNLANFGDSKNIMVVGVFGPQSSGKSTLLNFLFGCDFLSSDGRCTSGIYGTYYDIKNRSIPNCNGVLILDTEGLFGNYENKKCQNRENFDNKLVLFMLKVCDVLIMNTRGDVDVKCGNILELAFSCELMEHKPVSRYPNMYMVLNQSGGNMNETQQSEVQTLRAKVIGAAPHMKDFISTSDSNSMPLAFNISTSTDINSKVLEQIQNSAKIPTEIFYNRTKELATKIIMGILFQRGKDSQGRTLSDIYDEMGRVWGTITNIPMLTQYSSQKLKLFVESIIDWKTKRYQEMSDLVSSFRSSIPLELKNLKEWEEGKEREVRKKSEECVADFDKAFPNNQDPEHNTMIKLATPEIEVKLMSYFKELQIDIASVRSRMELEQSKDRGLDAIAKSAKQLRQASFVRQLGEQEKEAEFERVWKLHVDALETKFDRKSSSTKIFEQIRDLYRSQLKGITMGEDSLVGMGCEMEYEEYSESAKAVLLKQFPDAKLFEETTSAPAICTSRTGLTDMKFRYLDLTKFFSFVSRDIHYHLSAECLTKLFDMKQLEVEVVFQMARDSLVVGFVDQLTNQLAHFGVSIGRIHEIVTRAIVSSKKSFWSWLGAGRQVFKPEINLSLITCSHNTMMLLTQFLKGENSSAILPDLEDEVRKETKRYYHNASAIHILKETIEGAIQHFVKSLSDKAIKKVYTNTFQRFNSDAQAQLEKIGIRAVVSLSKNQVQLVKNSPVRVQQHDEILAIVDSFSAFFNKSLIKESISPHETQGSLRIAVTEMKSIIVNEEYSNQPTLNYFVNRQYKELIKSVKSTQFRTFIRKHIDVEAIVEFVGGTVARLEESIDIKSSVRECILRLQTEITLFDKDLQQVSRTLSYLFKSQLHNLCLHLLWKRHESRAWKHRKEDLSKIQQGKKQQKQIFMGMLSKDPNENSKKTAEFFIDKYCKYMLALSANAKEEWIETRSRIFLKQYTRERVQAELDERMRACTDKEEAYQFLMQPEKYLEEIYRKFAEDECVKVQQHYSSEVVKYFEDFDSKVRSVRNTTKGSNDDWFSDNIFEEWSETKPSTLVANIFLEVFSCNKTISSDTTGVGYKLKQGNFVFQLPSSFSHKPNTAFFLLRKQQPADFEIIHYMYFLQSLATQLSEKLKSILPELAIDKDDLDVFRNKVKLVLCQAKCHCCKRLCDIDMKEEMHHTLHRCSYGHQMRAVGGVRVEKKKAGKIRYYASVQRCEDMDPAGTFQFNAKEMTWQQFKDSKKNEWDLNFKTRNDMKQTMVFRRLWSLAGPRICSEWQAYNNVQMQYVDYSDEGIRELHKAEETHKVEETHYIIAIDGSYSMSGNRWNQLIGSLRSIFGVLSKAQNNHVSIIVLTESATLKWQKRPPQELDVDTIQYPGGGTTFGPTFALANQLLANDIGKMNLRFILISDGQAEYPEAEINKMRNFKQRAEQTHSFKYVSIMIGISKSDLMEKIRGVLDGDSSFVNSATEIPKKFNEVLINKK